ncbi:DMT family transporter [Marinobacter pelagius]|uniref:DMT family transporter n=1 Tax=Marinobacter sp. C7 TaxID=2951363 RepID=UPI001EEFA7E5|nr:DMT family transporter [Marinobacter sp. C7]MCG7201212.1 DMT family transporter [Marinobacter sp. C7]
MTALIQRFTPSPRGVVWGLLIANGFLIALMLALSKTATTQGMPPATYAFWQTLIAGSILLLRSTPVRSLLNLRLITYFFISGLSGIAIPNVTAFFLVSKLGTGFTSIMYALPPIFTFLIAASMGLEKRSWSRFSGLSVAVLACVWIILQRHSEVPHSSLQWYLLGLLIPVALSIGNIYRAVAWPRHSTPMTLAAGTLLACAVSLALFTRVTDTPLVSVNFGPGLQKVIVLQGVLTALAYLCAFEIQKRATPVFFSQLGAVAAVFGLVIGVVWFREQYTLTIWLGVMMVILGLRLSNRSGPVTRTIIQPHQRDQSHRRT